MEAELTHLDASGTARMVDVSAKGATERYARARAVVRMSPESAARVQRGDNPKGDVAAVARIAAIQAAKRTDELIPLPDSRRCRRVRAGGRRSGEPRSLCSSPAAPTRAP